MLDKRSAQRANQDYADDEGLGFGFSDKKLCALVRGKLLCFGHNHESQVSPISIENSNGVSEVCESAW